MTRNWLPVWCFSLSLLLFFIASPLTRHGMFLDGIVYAAIAKNLSLGHGTIWQLFFSKTELVGFYEHPPLAIYFQSLFFKYLGQGFYVERLYCLLMAVGQFSLLTWYWLKKERVVTLGFLLLIWGMIPLNHLYVSNLLEGTLTLFTTFVCVFYVLQTERGCAITPVKNGLTYFLCAFGMVIAFFCNGPTAFFPLALPVIIAIFQSDQRMLDGFKKTGCFLVIVVGIFLLVYTTLPNALYVTQRYFRQQLFPAITGVRQLNYVGFAHLHVVLLYVRAYMWVGLFGAFCHWLAFKIDMTRYPLTPRAKVWLSLSLVASLPIGISHKQAFSYLMQSAPFFTLFIAESCFKPFQVILAYCCLCVQRFRVFSLVNNILLIICSVFFLYHFNGYNRDKLMLQDIHFLVNYVGEQETLSASPLIFKKYYTGAYFARDAMISITPKMHFRYHLIANTEAIPAHYCLVPIPLSYYHLVKKCDA